MQRVQARDGPSSGAVVVFLSPPPPQKNQSTGPELETGWPWVRGAVLRELLFQFLPLIMCTPSYTHTHTHTHWQGQSTQTHTRMHTGWLSLQSFPGLRVDMVQWVYFRSQDRGSLLRPSGLGWATSLEVPPLDLT